jgi:hypothetical protein
MKSLFTIAFAALTLSSFAANGQDNDSTAGNDVIASVSNQICSEDIVSELGVSGTADISFTVDELGYVHLQEIQSNDFLLEYHVRRALEGMKLSVEESIVGKTFNFIMNVVQQD